MFVARLVVIIVSIACLFVFNNFVLAQPLGLMAGWQGARAGDAGPRHVKTLVTSNGVSIFFTPRLNIEYQVYRHTKDDDRHFVAHGAPVRLRAGGVLETTDAYNGEPGDSGWLYDATYDYLLYVDPAVMDYEEYYYLIWSEEDRDVEGRPVLDPNTYLTAYDIAPAFPPTQTRHGSYSEYTNACTLCHGLHSSRQEKLLKGPSITDLCGTCHDGTGSKYDEVRGRVRRGPAWVNAAFAPAGPFGDRLKENSGVIVTSVHNLMRVRNVSNQNWPPGVMDGSASIWQAPGSGYLADWDALQRDYNHSGLPDRTIQVYVSNNWGSYLVCTSCHEPHNRDKNFRLLRGTVNDRTKLVIRGGSEVDLSVAGDPSPDRGEWGNGKGMRRVAYTKHLAGGGSTLYYYDPRVEDPFWAPGEPDSSDLDGDGDIGEPRARAFCEAEGGTLMEGDSASPTGYRCRLQRDMGGITSFCTACHRGFISPTAAVARDSYAYPYAGGVILGLDQSQVTNSGGRPLGLSSGEPAASLEEVLGQHRHPLSIPAANAYRQGLIIDGVLASDGEVCHEGETVPGGSAPDPRCGGVVQARLVDPVIPLEGQHGDRLLTDDPYSENLVTCLTCHVAHGSGSERLAVAYIQPDLNDSGSAQRDPVTGYAQVSVSSVLARFNPMASACYRCHSTTPAW